jgi:hypothetical protein
MPVVEVQGVGVVEFPDDMSQEDIVTALNRKFYKAPTPSFPSLGEQATLPEVLRQPEPTFDIEGTPRIQTGKWMDDAEVGRVPVARKPEPMDPNSMLPAMRLVGGDVVVGEPGDTHPDIIKRHSLSARDIDQRGFYANGKFVDRRIGQESTGLPTEREPGNLHSTDLPGYKRPESELPEDRGPSMWAYVPGELLKTGKEKEIADEAEYIRQKRQEFVGPIAPISGFSDEQKRMADQIESTYNARMAMLPWNEPDKYKPMMSQLQQWREDEMAKIGIQTVSAFERPRLGQPLTKQEQETLFGKGLAGKAIGAAARQAQGLGETFVQPEMLMMGPGTMLERAIMPKAERIMSRLTGELTGAQKVSKVLGESFIPVMAEDVAAQGYGAIDSAVHGDWDSAFEKGASAVTAAVMISMPAYAAMRRSQQLARIGSEVERPLREQLAEVEESLFQIGDAADPEKPALLKQQADLQQRIDRLETWKQEVADAARGTGRKVEVTDRDLGRGKIAVRNKDGSITINENVLRQLLEIDAKGDPGLASEAIKRLVNHEVIHGAINDRMALDYWNTLTDLEKKLEMSLYPGSEKISDTLKGHEAFRRRMELANGLSHLEFIRQTAKERWSNKSKSALLNTLTTVREVLATSGADAAKLQQQVNLINRAQRRLIRAREGAKDALEPKEAQPVRDVLPQPGARPGEVPPSKGGPPPGEGRGKEGLEGKEEVLLGQDELDLMAEAQKRKAAGDHQGAKNVGNRLQERMAEEDPDVIRRNNPELTESEARQQAERNARRNEQIANFLGELDKAPPAAPTGEALPGPEPTGKAPEPEPKPPAPPAAISEPKAEVKERQVLSPEEELLQEFKEEGGEAEEPFASRLVPAIWTGTKHETGRSHGDIFFRIARAGDMKELSSAELPQSKGFMFDGKFVTREEGARIFKELTGMDTATPGVLTSEDLWRAGMLRDIPRDLPFASRSTLPEYLQDVDNVLGMSAEEFNRAIKTGYATKASSELAASIQTTEKAQQVRDASQKVGDEMQVFLDKGDPQGAVNLMGKRQFFQEAAQMHDARNAVMAGVDIAEAANLFGVEEPNLRSILSREFQEELGPFASREDLPENLRKLLDEADQIRVMIRQASTEKEPPKASAEHDLWVKKMEAAQGGLLRIGSINEQVAKWRESQPITQEERIAAFKTKEAERLAAQEKRRRKSGTKWQQRMVLPGVAKGAEVDVFGNPVTREVEVPQTQVEEGKWGPEQTSQVKSLRAEQDAALKSGDTARAKEIDLALLDLTTHMPTSIRVMDRAKQMAGVPIQSGVRPSGKEGQAPARIRKYPRFADFYKWARRNFPSMTRSQAESAWRDAVNEDTINSSPERLADWVDTFDLGSILRLPRDVTGRVTGIVPRAAEQRFSLAKEMVGESAVSNRRKANALNKEADRMYSQSETEKDPVKKSWLETQAARARTLASQLSEYEPSRKITAREEKLGAEFLMRRRDEVVKLVSIHRLREVAPRADLDRKAVTIEDIDFGNPILKQGAYRVIDADEAKDIPSLLEILRQGARVKGEPMAHTHAILVVAEKDGTVHLVSSFNDFGTQRVLNPASGTLPIAKDRPNIELTADFLRKYRPIAVMKVKDPVRNFYQRYRKVSDFEKAIGKDAADFEKSAKWTVAGKEYAEPKTDRELREDEREYWWAEMYGEGAEEIEGTPGIREGGMFQGPGARELRHGRGEISRSYVEPLKTSEAEALLDFVLDEAAPYTTGTVDTMEGFVSAIKSLTTRAREKLTKGQQVILEKINSGEKVRWRELQKISGRLGLEPQHRLVISALQKIAERIQSENKGMTPKKAVGVALKQIYDHLQGSREPWVEGTERHNPQTFALSILNRFSPRPAEPVSAPGRATVSRAEGLSRELAIEGPWKRVRPELAGAPGKPGGRPGSLIPGPEMREPGVLTPEEMEWVRSQPTLTDPELTMGGELIPGRPIVYEPTKGFPTMEPFKYGKPTGELPKEYITKPPPGKEVKKPTRWELRAEGELAPIPERPGETPAAMRQERFDLFEKEVPSKRDARILGNVDHNGAVRAADVAPYEVGAEHGEYGLVGHGRRWRYSGISEGVVWTETPNRSDMDAVDGYLTRRGMNVKKHSSFAGDVYRSGGEDRDMSMPYASRALDSATEEYLRIQSALASGFNRFSVSRDIPRTMDGLEHIGVIESHQVANMIRMAAQEGSGSAADKRARMLLGAARAEMATREKMSKKDLKALKKFNKRYSLPMEIPDPKPNAGSLNKNLQYCEVGIMKAKNMMARDNPVDRWVGRRWLAAAQKLKQEVVDARDNWSDPKLHEVAEATKQALKDQLAREKEKGSDVQEYENYLPGLYEGETYHEGFLRFGAWNILGRNFRQAKRFPNHYEAIANGPYIPAAWSVADIAEHRIRRGNYVIARREWEQGLKGMVDPASKKKIAVEPQMVSRVRPTIDPETGKQKMTEEGQPVTHNETGWTVPDQEHILVDPTSGSIGTYIHGRKPICVRKGFEDIVSACCGKSVVRQSRLGRMALYGTSFLKHNWILMLDTFHPGRLAQFATMLTPNIWAKITGRPAPGFGAGYKGGYSALTYRPEDVQLAVSAGKIPQEAADWANGTVNVQLGKGRSVSMARHQILQEAVRMGLNAGKISDALYKEAGQNIPVVGPILKGTILWYNKKLFDHFVPGLIAESAVRAFESMNAKNPNVPIGRLLKDIIRDSNAIYGNMSRQGVFRNATLKDVLQILLLAPSWREGLFQKEIRYLARLPAAVEHGGRLALSKLGAEVDPARSFTQRLTGREGLPPMGMLGGMMTKGIVAYFAMNQVINLISTYFRDGNAKFTWQNDDANHKMDAWLPFGQYGMWLPTLGVFGEIVGDIVRLGETKPTMYERFLQVGVNSLGPVGKAADILRTRETPTGRRLTTSRSILGGAAGQIVGTTPISLTEPLRAAGHLVAPSLVPPGEPGMGWQRGFGSMGFKMARGVSPVKQIAGMVKEYNRSQGYPEEPTIINKDEEASLSNLRHAIRIGDEPGAQRAYLGLVEKYEKIPRGQGREGVDSEDMVMRAMASWADRPFTGSQAREDEFLSQLDSKGWELYNRAESERLDEYTKFVDFVMKLPKSVTDRLPKTM